MEAMLQPGARAAGSSTMHHCQSRVLKPVLLADIISLHHLPVVSACLPRWLISRPGGTKLWPGEWSGVENSACTFNVPTRVSLRVFSCVLALLRLAGVSPAAARLLEELLLGCCCREERATLLPEACVPPGLEVGRHSCQGCAVTAPATDFIDPGCRAADGVREQWRLRGGWYWVPHCGGIARMLLSAQLSMWVFLLLGVLWCFLTVSST
jgi:hypothetical protein